jgi:Na+/melibiose symporter-like transporter
MSNDQIREGHAPPRFQDEDYPALYCFPREELARNRLHLRMLSGAYYVVGLFFGLTGGMGAFFLCRLANNPNLEGHNVLLGVGAFMFVFYVALAIALIVAGHSLAMHRHYVYCLVMASFLLLNGVPGIVLGILTILVLMRDSMRELFQRGELAFEADADHE